MIYELGEIRPSLTLWEGSGSQWLCLQRGHCWLWSQIFKPRVPLTLKLSSRVTPVPGELCSVPQKYVAFRPQAGKFPAQPESHDLLSGK